MPRSIQTRGVSCSKQSGSPRSWDARIAEQSGFFCPRKAVAIYLRMTEIRQPACHKTAEIWEIKGPCRVCEEVSASWRQTVFKVSLIHPCFSNSTNSNSNLDATHQNLHLQQFRRLACRGCLTVFDVWMISNACFPSSLLKPLPDCKWDYQLPSP